MLTNEHVRESAVNGTRRAPARTQDAYPISSPLEKLSAIVPSFSPSGASSSSNSVSWPPPWLQDAMKDPAKAAILSGGCAAAGTVIAFGVYRRYFRRIPNADSVTAAMIRDKRKIHGVVTRVGDGDGFRLYHTPGPFWRYPLKLRHVPKSAKGLRNETLSIRIAGIDAPELGHFGKAEQPYAREALEWLTDRVDGKRVKCQLLRKDQYGRIVAVPWIHRTLLPDKPLPLMMLREGLAVVYTQGGAEFGPWGLDKLQAAEEEAKRHRRGMWSARKVELPGDYKRRMREGDDKEVAVDTGRRVGFWERLGRWLGGKT